MSEFWVSTIEFAIAVLVFLVFGSIVAGSRSILRIAKVILVKIQPDDDRWRTHIEQTAHSSEWASLRGFELVGYFHLEGSTVEDNFIAGWRHKTLPTFFSHYVFNKIDAFDLVTVYADDVSLTTARSLGAHFCPRPPGTYMQSFPKAGLDDLLSHHNEMDMYLFFDGQAKPHGPVESFENLLNESLLCSSKFVRSLPLWPLRIPYWFFVRRFRMRGLTIRKQHERGMIKMPNELTELGLLQNPPQSDSTGPQDPFAR